MDEQKRAIDTLREYQLFRRREETEPHMSYRHEKERHRLICQGRVDEIERAIKTPPDGTAGVLAKNELRNAKNMLITSITLFTRAAMDGGLDEETAYAMSDSYIQSGEECTSIEAVEGLYLRALREFTSAVAKSKRCHYSRVIENVIHYIHIHLHQKISLEKAAAHAGVSPCHLSRIFKREVGESFVEYIQKERVKSAEHMLIYSLYSISEISEYLHFSTQSYFIKIFQKYRGMTPYCYRKYYREKGAWQP